MRTGLGVKLSLMIGLLVAASLCAVTLMASHFVGEDVRITAQSNNLTINSRSASIASDRLNAIKDNVLSLLDITQVLSGPEAKTLSRQAVTFFFERNKDIACVMVLQKTSLSMEGSAQQENSDDIKLVNAQFLISNETDEDAIDTAISSNEDNVIAACDGEEKAVNASQYLSFPAMMMLFPWKERGKDEAIVIIISMEGLSDMLGTASINSTFMTNSAGDLLSYNDTQRLLAGENLMTDPFEGLLVKRGLLDTEGAMARQELFTSKSEDDKENKFYGAWQKIPVLDIWVFTTVPLKAVTEAVDKTRQNNFYLTGAIMFLSMIFILIYVKGGITQPLKRLTLAAEEIQKGNFDTNIIDHLNTKRHDEIGVLNLSTQHEREFLITFSRFTNRAVAKSIATRTLDFAPHLKDLTILFSDIRGFTAISAGFRRRFGDESPKEIIAFLNDYMARMVNCVTLSGGNIDKFEGDAIMGVWGILRDDSLDERNSEESEAHKKHILEDAINCIKGTLAMRYALMEYNKSAALYEKEHPDRMDSYKPHIRIGCGINSGRATAGIMGSEHKMEYTAIGDAVNFASRTESSNKSCGTDILIAEDTYNLIKRKYIRCKENNYTIEDECLPLEITVEMIPVTIIVKGKGEEHFYGVVNMPHFDIEAFFKKGDESFVVDEECSRALGPNGPKTLNDVRSLLGIPMPDFAKVNLNIEENKSIVLNGAA